MNRSISGITTIAIVLYLAGNTIQLWAEQPDETRRHVEKAGGFYFIPPEGWEAKEFPGLKFKIVAGPPAGNFAPNMNVVDESFKDSLDKYVDANLTALKGAFKSFRLIKRDEIKTSIGARGARLTVESDQNGTLMRQVFYFFSSGDKKFVVTFTGLSEWEDKHDNVVENSMKTFRFDKR